MKVYPIRTGKPIASLRRRRGFAALLLGGALVLPLAGCGAAEREPPQTEAACAAAGGRWAKGGRAGIPQCFTGLPDAGKPCSRDGECQGACIVVAGKGQCQKTQPMFGCTAFLDADGRTQRICRD